MNTFLVNILLHALALVPDILADVEKVLAANWTHPTSQAAVAGLASLTNAVEKIVPGLPKSDLTLVGAASNVVL